MKTSRRLHVVLLSLLATFGLGACASTAPLTPPPTPEPAVDYSLPTAREAYVPALIMARSEDLGAQLASAVGAWTPNTYQIQIESGRTGWTFHFYLPALDELLTIVVDDVDDPRITGRKVWEVEPELIDDDTWRIDSADAIMVMMQNCRPITREVTNVIVEARFSTALSNGRLLWEVKARDLEGIETLCHAEVDAISGIKQ